MKSAACVRRSVAALAAALALAVAGAPATANASAARTAAPATAAAAKFCGNAPSKHIGKLARVGTTYARYGTAEWRYGTSGACKGYKWVVVYITSPSLWVHSWAVTIEDINQNYGTYRPWYGQFDHGFHIPDGSVWHSNALYGYHVSLMAALDATTSYDNWVYFGHDEYWPYFLD